jgi:hypothetical protein
MAAKHAGERTCSGVKRSLTGSAINRIFETFPNRITIFELKSNCSMGHRNRKAAYEKRTIPRQACQACHASGVILCLFHFYLLKKLVDRMSCTWSYSEVSLLVRFNYPRKELPAVSQYG